MPAVSLSLEPANITAVANDVGTEVIFLRQLIAQARPEDVAIGISTSGGSRNIIMALEEARKRKLATVALLGYDGGEIVRRGLADFPIVVRVGLHSAHSGSAGVHLPYPARGSGFARQQPLPDGRGSVDRAKSTRLLTVSSKTTNHRPPLFHDGAGRSSRPPSDRQNANRAMPIINAAEANP